MRMIGLIGGMSWESTATYYRRINEQARARLGGLHSAEIVMRSVDFDTIVRLQKAGAWDEAGACLATIARDLEAAGAECLLVCTNTMHKLAGEIERAVRIPLLHIADSVADALVAQGRRRPLLLATRFTMEQEFYLARLRRHGLAPLVPDVDDRQAVHDVIFEELCRGVVRAESRQRCAGIVARGAAVGANSVIFGCTEIGLLLDQGDVLLPALNSTLLHADAAVDFALAAGQTARVA